MFIQKFNPYSIELHETSNLLHAALYECNCSCSCRTFSYMYAKVLMHVQGCTLILLPHTCSYSLYEPNSPPLAEYESGLEKAILRDSELMACICKTRRDSTIAFTLHVQHAR